MPLPQPFLVIATQNPVEHHGTYPLPESQLDRFLMRVKMARILARNEREILRSRRSDDPLLLWSRWPMSPTFSPCRRP